MGLFDKFKKKEKQENKVEEIKETEELNAQGWAAITAECDRVYPNQTNPKQRIGILK